MPERRGGRFQPELPPDPRARGVSQLVWMPCVPKKAWALRHARTAALPSATTSAGGGNAFPHARVIARR